MDNDIESSVAQKASLSDHQLAILSSEAQKRSKSVAVAYILWLFLGGLGGHRYYLGKVGSGLCMAALLVIGLITAAIIIGLFFLAALAIWEIVDAFLIPRMTREVNAMIENRIMLAVRSSSLPSQR